MRRELDSLGLNFYKSTNFFDIFVWKGLRKFLKNVNLPNFFALSDSSKESLVPVAFIREEKKFVASTSRFKYFILSVMESY